jgi:predicted GNAT superfamily acetyltransferase
MFIYCIDIWYWIKEHINTFGKKEDFLVAFEETQRFNSSEQLWFPDVVSKDDAVRIAQ